MNRRTFLSYTTTGSVAALLEPFDAIRQQHDIPSLKQFQTLVGKTFRAGNSSGETVRIRLHSVEQLRQPLVGTESFSLLFRSPHGDLLQQDVYRLRRRGSFACSLLIVPVVGEGYLPEYQTIINRRSA